MMAKKLSGWYRVFIVFAGVWTLLSIGYLTLEVVRYNTDTSYPTIESTKKIIKKRKGLYGRVKERTGIDFYDPTDVRIEHKKNLRVYYKGIRKMIYFFFLYWLAPIGLVYGSGHCAGWIIRGFRKDKE